MALNEKALRFLELAEYLYRNDWVYFRLQDRGWTKNYEGEEKIFAIFIRTLLCNELPSKSFFMSIGGYQGVMKEKAACSDLEHWLTKKIEPYTIGKGRGSHRTNWWQKKSTPQGIVDYLELTENGQKEFFDKFSNYNELFNCQKQLLVLVI